VPPEPGARVVALAGDGAGRAAVAYEPAGDPAGAGAPPCRLALVDLAAEGPRVATAGPVCPPGERAQALALGAAPGGPVAYLALWAPAGARGDGGAPQPRHGSVVAVDGLTGAPLAVARPDGVPARLALGPAGRGLYCVVGAPGPAPEDEARRGVFAGAARWRLLALDPDTLDERRAYPLPGGPVPPVLAVAPEGDAAYVLRGRDGGRSELLHLDLRAGALAPLVTLPGLALGLAVTPERVYVTHADGDEVWTVQRRSGRVGATLPVGRGPVALALEPPA
jgi:hypothetical protein